MDGREHKNALNSLWNFISADYETRLARSGKLNDFIDGGMDYFLGPTGIPNKARAANTMINPIAQMGQAGADATVATDPRYSRDERINAGVNALTGTLATLAPAAFMKAAGRPAADAVMETLVNTSRPLAVDGISDAARRFAMSEDGSVPAARALTPQQEMAERILEMRAAGNAADVTDEMMAMADDVTMFNRTPLPMDEASRMARAQEAGFGGDLYHGTNNEFDAFRAMPWGGETPNIANEYAASKGWDGDTGQRVLPVRMAVNSPLDADRMPKTVTIGDFVTESLEQSPAVGRGEFNTEMADARINNIRRGAMQEESGPHYNRHDFWNNDASMFGTHGKLAKDALMNQLGFDGVKMIEMGEPTTGVFDATKARSRFARFDPEFAHLGNLSAGVAGLGVVGLGATQGQQTDDPYAQRNTLAEVMRPAFGNALNGYTPPLPRNALQRGF